MPVYSTHSPCAWCGVALSDQDIALGFIRHPACEQVKDRIDRTPGGPGYADEQKRVLRLREIV